MRSLVHLCPVRGRVNCARSLMGGLVDKFIDCSTDRMVKRQHTVPPSLCLAQHIVVTLLRATKRLCRLSYLVLTGAFRTCVQAGNGCAITGKTEVVMGSACNVLSHRGRYELG